MLRPQVWDSISSMVLVDLMQLALLLSYLGPIRLSAKLIELINEIERVLPLK